MIEGSRTRVPQDTRFRPGISFGSQVSAIGCLVQVSRFRCRFGKSVICHPSSIQSSPHFGWQVAASGGRWRDLSIQSSTQSSTQPSIQSSHFAPVICHPSSIQPSSQVAGLIHSVLHAVLNAALHSVLPFCPCHPSSVIYSAIHAAPTPIALRSAPTSPRPLSTCLLSWRSGNGCSGVRARGRTTSRARRRRRSP